MHRFAFLALSALLASTAASTATGVQAKAMKWMDGPAVGLPAGAKLAVVSGDPSKTGKFVIRAKFPANYTVPPHNHPGDETVRVISGGPLTYGMGTKVDTSNSGSLTKGYHVTLAAGMNHWASSATATTIQVSGNGPFAITYVNPADDPRTKK